MTTANGSLWYLESTSSATNDSIGNMTTSGTVTDYNISAPIGSTSFSIRGLTTGPDGNVWFDGCADTTGSVYTGFLNVSTGAVTFYENNYGGITCFGGGSPGPITTGSDGYIWYADHNYDYAGFHEYFFSVNPSTGAGSTAYYAATNNTVVGSLTTGPDGRLWGTNSQYNQILAETVSSGSRTAENEYNVPTSSSGPGSIVTGPDGNLWFAETGVSPHKIRKSRRAGHLLSTPKLPVCLREVSLLVLTVQYGSLMARKLVALAAPVAFQSTPYQAIRVAQRLVLTVLPSVLMGRCGLRT